MPRWATIGLVLYTILAAITAVVWFQLAGSLVLVAAGIGIGLASSQPADDRLLSGSSIHFRHGSSEPF